MIFHFTEIALLLHVFFWGLGGAMLAMPRPWVKFWPALIFPAGWALQSLVVWIAAYADLRGTSSYGWYVEIVPVILLVAGILRGEYTGHRFSDIARFAAVFGISVFAALVLVWPLAKAAHGLTTFSLGSCDAADYAAGARTLTEFAHSDRGGFLGLTEVVRVMSVDNFFDFWLRLNHFTPAAVIALNDSILGDKSYQLTSLVAVALLATSAPTVFWLARAGLKYRSGLSLWIALIYVLSPITWYAVYQVAMGQLLAAQAIAVLTWSGFALWRGSMAGKRVGQYFGPLLIGYLLVLGSYNFILLVAMVPALGFAFGIAVVRAQWRKFCMWLGTMLVPLLVAAVVLFARTAGLVERFQLLGQYDFGWKIPVLGPEGWLGMVGGIGLESYSTPLLPVLRCVLAAIILGSCILIFRRKRDTAWAIVCCTLPALAGYFYLQWRGAHLGTNASYDAYKLLAVFYPGVLGGICCWGCGRIYSRQPTFGLPLILGLLLTSGTFVVAWRFEQKMRNPPLLVSESLVQVQTIEALPRVESVNMYIPDMWSRLWANDFLLRKPQYFLTHTYEGRINTPLRGAWDLHGGIIEVRLPNAGSISLNSQYSLSNTRNRDYFRAAFGDGWYDLESLPRTAIEWRWSRGAAKIELENPQNHSVHVSWEIDARSLVAREFQIFLNQKPVGTIRISPERATVSGSNISLPPGHSNLEFRATTAVGPASPADRRALGLAAYHLAFSAAVEPIKVPELRIQKMDTTGKHGL